MKLDEIISYCTRMNKTLKPFEYNVPENVDVVTSCVDGWFTKTTTVIKDYEFKLNALKLNEVTYQDLTNFYLEKSEEQEHFIKQYLSTNKHCRRVYIIKPLQFMGYKDKVLNFQFILGFQEV